MYGPYQHVALCSNCHNVLAWVTTGRVRLEEGVVERHGWFNKANYLGQDTPDPKVIWTNLCPICGATPLTLRPGVARAVGWPLSVLRGSWELSAKTERAIQQKRAPDAREGAVSVAEEVTDG